jgi:ribosomal protein S12 methylthiotransferase accessory factor
VIKKPRLKNKFRCELVDSEGVFLLSETETIFLGNPLFQKIIPLLDGTLTEEEIVDKLRTELPEAYIFYALMELEQKGFIVENDLVLEPNLTLFCESLSLDIHNVQKRLQSSQVSLRALGSLSCKNLRDSL